jgi:DNA-binding transcriptional ArsR family regulator
VDQRLAKPELDAAFAALSDSSRREMIRMLLHKPRRAGELAEGVDMSPQALSRHLRVLRKAGLVSEEGIEADAQVEELWRCQLQAFKSYAESSARGRKPKT